MLMVKIQLRSYQQEKGGEYSGGEWETTGYYLRENNQYRLFYQEPAETGLDTRTEITVDGEELTVRRRGAVEMEQSFCRGGHCRGNYRTPYGQLALETRTIQTEVNLTETGGNIKLKYELFLAGEYIGIHWLEINFQAE